MKKKKLLISIILLSFSITAISVANPNAIHSYLNNTFLNHLNSAELTWYLVLWQKDGSKIVFSLNEMPKITYVGDKVIVKSSSILEFDFQSIKKMTYSQDSSLSVNDLSILKKEIPFSNNGKTITFFPAEKEQHVKVFLINGMVVKDIVVPMNETYSFSLNSSMGNTFIVSVNGVTYKILIR